MGTQRGQLNVGCLHPIIKEQTHCSRPGEAHLPEPAGQSVISPREASKDDASDRDAGVIAETGHAAALMDVGSAGSQWYTPAKPLNPTSTFHRSPGPRRPSPLPCIIKASSQSSVLGSPCPWLQWRAVCFLLPSTDYTSHRGPAQSGRTDLAGRLRGL